MARPNSSKTTTGADQSSITLLQERFRQLRRAKEMREEKKMSKMLAAKPANINNHTSSNKLHLQPHQFKSSSASSASFSAAAKSRAMMMGFDSVRFDGRSIESSGASQSRSSMFPSSSSSSSLSFRHSNNNSHHDQYSRRRRHHQEEEEEKRSLKYYCDIGKFLQANNNDSDHDDEEVVCRQSEIVRNVHDVDQKMTMKRFDRVGGCDDDIDTSLHL